MAKNTEQKSIVIFLVILSPLILIMGCDKKSGADEFAAAQAEALRQEELADLRYFLERGYSSSTASLTDVKLNYHVRHWRDLTLRSEIPGTEELFSSYAFIRKNSNEFLAFLSASDTLPDSSIFEKINLIGTVDSPDYSVLSNQIYLNYYSTQGTDDSVTQQGRAIIKQSNFGPFTYSHQSPKHFFGYNHGAMPNDVLSSEDSEISAEPETLNGLITYKITGTVELSNRMYIVEYWLCPDRSGFPVRMELRETNGQLRRIMTYNNFLQLDNGVWFPSEVIKEYYINEGDDEPKVINTETYILSEIELSPKVDEGKLFNYLAENLPEGTLLYDSISGLRYTM